MGCMEKWDEREHDDSMIFLINDKLDRQLEEMKLFKNKIRDIINKTEDTKK